MKKTIKLLSIVLTVALILNIITVAMPALAIDLDEITSEQETEITQDSCATDDLDSDADIVGEDESRRDETTKHFLLSNGMYQAVKYSQPVHYKENGKWEEIDNTLEYNEKEEKYENKSNYFKVQFDKKLNSDKLFTFENKGHSLSWEYNAPLFRGMTVKANISEVAQNTDSQSAYLPKDNGKVEYDGFESNCKLEYVVTATGVKENIILEKPNTENEFEFNISSDGLCLEKNSDGSISAYSIENKEEVFFIPAPFMYDSNDSYSYDVSYKLDEKDGKYSITVVANDDWLQSNERTYPVTIDPVIQTKRARTDIDSTFIASDSAYSSKNMSAMLDLYIGWDTYQYGKTRTLVKFDLPELNKGDMIVGASLAIAEYKTSFYSVTTPDQQIDAHIITGRWSKSDVTWSNQPSYNSVISDYDYIKRTDEASWKYFDITKAVKEWYEGTIANNGILLKQHTEGSDEAETGVNACFWSEKYNDGTNAYPSIIITYRNNKGVEDYWSYSAYSIDSAGTAFVNDYSGNLVYELPVFSSNSEIMPLTLTAVYNTYCANVKYVAGKSGSSLTTPGRGFRLNIQETLLPSTQYGLTGNDSEKYPYVYTDGDGTEHYIQKTTEKDSNGKEQTVYKDEDGLGYTVSSGDGYKYKLVDKSGTVRQFNGRGNLFKIVDTNGNYIHIVFKEADEKNNIIDRARINYILDGAGHKLTFDYYETDGVENGYIKTITDNAGRVTTFTTKSGLLRGLTAYDKTKTKLNYVNEDKGTETDEGLINYVLSHEGYELNFDYTSLKNGRRVSRVKEYAATNDEKTSFTAGQWVTFDRSKYNTTVIRTAGIDGCHIEQDSSKGDDDIVTTLQFDNLGRIVSQQLSYGNKGEIGAGVCNYTGSVTDKTTSFKKNKTSQSASVGKNTVNLLKSGNAESNDGWAQIRNDTVSATLGLSSSVNYMGKYSLYIKNNSFTDNGMSYYRQGITPSVNTNYTLSAYVKTDELTAKYNTVRHGAYIQLTAYDANGNALDVAYSSVLSSKSVSSDNGWQRLTVTLNVPEGATKLNSYLCLRDVMGTAYFDSIQLEKGASASNFNMLENSSFESRSSNKPVSWSNAGDFEITTDSKGVIKDGVSDAAHRDGSYSLRIAGYADKSKGVAQTVAVQPNPSDTYILSGWGAAYAVNTTYHDNAKFEIGIKVNYTCIDTTTNKKTSVSQYKTAAKFNTTVSGWQYSSTPIVLKYTGGESEKTYTPVSITVIPRYCYQTNWAYFDKIMLTKEPVPTYTYDKKGNLVSTTAADKTVNTVYDDDNNLTSYTDTAGYKTTAVYDKKHNLTSVTSPRGLTTAYSYKNGNVSVTEIRNSKNTIALRTGNTYNTDVSGVNDGAYLVKSTDQHGYATKYTYNYKTGAPLTVTNAENTVTTNTYTDETYTKLRSVETAGTKVTYNYAKNRVSKITYGDSAKETYGFEYDYFGNATKTTVGSNALITKTYAEKNGLLTSEKYGNGDTKSYTYSKNGAVNGIKLNGSSSKAYGWAYNGAGAPTLYRDAVNNRKFIYTYDSLGRLIKQEIQTNNGTTHIGSTEIAYDKRNNVNKVTAEFGGRAYSQVYSYSQRDENKENSASYAKDNLPTVYKMAGTRYAVYGYDTLNRLNERMLSTDTPLYTNYTYKIAANRTKSGVDDYYRTTQLSTEFLGNDSYTYYYDKVGNITQIKKGRRKSTEYGTDDFKTVASASTIATYTYDKLGQLTSETLANIGKISYTYDELGNMLSQNGANKGIVYTYDKDSDAGWNNLLKSIKITENGETKTESFDYDAIGNPITYRGNALTWFGRQLKTFKKNGTTVSYTYDADGMRATKKVGSVKSEYNYLDGQLAYEKRGEKEFYFQYDSYGNLTRILYYADAEAEIKAFYVLTNARGDVVSLHTGAGDVYATYEYDSWGNCIAVKNAKGDIISNENHIANLNPIRYRGYYYDTETNLYYLQSRYYDPEIGRFINADGYISTGQGVLSYNMFAYCGNNPLNHIDPKGGFSILIIGLCIIGATTVIGGILGATTDEPLIKSSRKAKQQKLEKQKLPKEPDYIMTNKKDKTIREENLKTTPKLTTGQRIQNVFIGATLGMAVGGALVTLGAMFTTPVIGITLASRLFAIGALAFDAEAIIFAPFYSVDLDPIEWE